MSCSIVVMQQDTTGGVLINFHELSAVAYIHVTCSSLCQILLKFVSLIMSVYYKGRLAKCTYTYVTQMLKLFLMCHIVTES